MLRSSYIRRARFGNSVECAYRDSLAVNSRANAELATAGYNSPYSRNAEISLIAILGALISSPKVASTIIKCPLWIDVIRTYLAPFSTKNQRVHGFSSFVPSSKVSARVVVAGRGVNVKSPVHSCYQQNIISVDKSVESSGQRDIGDGRANGNFNQTQITRIDTCRHKRFYNGLSRDTKLEAA